MQFTAHPFQFVHIEHLPCLYKAGEIMDSIISMAVMLNTPI
jgi:hypothetical protein